MDFFFLFFTYSVWKSQEKYGKIHLIADICPHHKNHREKGGNRYERTKKTKPQTVVCNIAVSGVLLYTAAYNGNGKSKRAKK